MIGHLLLAEYRCHRLPYGVWASATTCAHRVAIHFICVVIEPHSNFALQQKENLYFPNFPKQTIDPIVLNPLISFKVVHSATQPNEWDIILIQFGSIEHSVPKINAII